MSAFNAHISFMVFVICLNTLVFHRAYAYVLRNENLLGEESASAQSSPTSSLSSLASKVIYQSQPQSLANVYNEFFVSSKPLSLRKYGTNGQTAKKTKTDSKIYFISIPALPYRFIPGVGYDYQPMKINPILKEKPQSDVHENNQNTQFPQQPNFMISTGAEHHQKMTSYHPYLATTTTTPTPVSQTESKIYHIKRGDYYILNGRPLRLQVAHAQRKHHLTPQNLKTNFYYDKNIIY